MPAERSDADKLFDRMFKGSSDSAYDRDEFYVRATNKHDHSKNIQTPFPDTIFSEIHNMVRRGHFPKLTSPQALIRDAVVHSLHYLAEKEGNYEVMEVLNAARILSRQEDWKQHRREMREILSNLEENLTEAFTDRDWREAASLCDEAEMDLDGMNELFQGKVWEIIGRARKKIDEEKGKDW